MENLVLKRMKEMDLRGKHISISNELVDSDLRDKKINPYIYLILFFLKINTREAIGRNDNSKYAMFSINDLGDFVGIKHDKHSTENYQKIIDVLNEYKEIFFFESKGVLFINKSTERKKLYLLKVRNEAHMKKNKDGNIRFFYLYYGQILKILSYKENPRIKENIKEEDYINPFRVLTFYIYYQSRKNNFENMRNRDIKYRQNCLDIYNKTICDDISVGVNTIPKIYKILEVLQLIEVYRPKRSKGRDNEWHTSKIVITDYKVKGKINPYTGKREEYSSSDEIKYRLELLKAMHELKEEEKNVWGTKNTVSEFNGYLEIN